MTESEVDRPPRLGFGRYDLVISGGDHEREPWILTPDVLRDPSRPTLVWELEEARERANGRSRVRLVSTLSPDPVLAHPHGVMEDNGLPDAGGYGFKPQNRDFN